MEMHPHTYRRIDEQLRLLRRQLLDMGALVEQQIINALAALMERDDALAKQTVIRDHLINQIDKDIDELCVQLLARYQPAAGDLRLITTALKITTDLERMGDLAAHICERAQELNAVPALLPLIDIPEMADIAQRMVRESLDAFVRDDIELALEVCAADDQIDALHGQLFRVLLSYMSENPQTIPRAIRLLSVTKCLERIADHATNVAEMVIFMVKGKRIRHIAPVPDRASLG
jgi:phosphate transport system protein